MRMENIRASTKSIEAALSRQVPILQEVSLRRTWKPNAQQFNIHLSLSLSEQQLHPLFHELGVRNELELHCCSVTCAQYALRVVHPDYPNGLSDSLWYVNYRLSTPQDLSGLLHSAA